MRTLWRTITRVLFWSYERGTWQYDLAVLGIVIFVLLSPFYIHYSDQPSIGPQPASAAGASIVTLRAVAPGQISTYRVDARVLAPPIRTPELENDLHEAVRKNVSDLNHGRFEIVHIDPVWGDGGTIAYYDVSVKP